MNPHVCAASETIADLANAALFRHTVPPHRLKHIAAIRDCWEPPRSSSLGPLTAPAPLTANGAVPQHKAEDVAVRDSWESPPSSSPGLLTVPSQTTGGRSSPGLLTVSSQTTGSDVLLHWDEDGTDLSSPSVPLFTAGPLTAPGLQQRTTGLNKRPRLLRPFLRSPHPRSLVPLRRCTGPKSSQLSAPVGSRPRYPRPTHSPHPARHLSYLLSTRVRQSLSAFRSPIQTPSFPAHRHAREPQTTFTPHGPHHTC
jgi:hypothetical protein